MINDDATITARRLTTIADGARQWRFLLAIGVGLCCSAGLLLTANQTLNQAGWIDPYVYTGYVNDYSGLLDRFGPTYYSERIAYIYPARAFTYLFGQEGGYFAFRFFALACAVAAVFAIGARFYGNRTAILAAVWLTFTPWLPRSLLWTYCDGIAVVYLLVGITFLLPHRRRLISHATAGVAFALAVNCNLFLLAIGGLLSPGWVFFYRREGIAWLGRATLVLTAGFFATYLALALLLYAQFPSYGFSFEFVTLRVTIGLLGGGGLKYFEPLSSIIWHKQTFTLLIPVTFALAALVVVGRRPLLARTADWRTDFELFAVSYLVSIICLSLILHFGFHDAWLATPMYISYFVPGCVLALIVIGGEAERYGGRVFGNAATYAGIGLILFSWLASSVLTRLRIESTWSFWLSLAAISIGAAAAQRRIAAASVVLIAAVVLLSLCFYQESFYRIRGNTPERAAVEWDIYSGATFLQKFVNADVRSRDSVGFWYARNDRVGAIAQLRGEPLVGYKMTGPLDSIQSTYLWQYTRVFPYESPGMPLVDEQFLDKIAPRRFLVLLGSSDAETNSGLSALEAAKLPFREVKRAHFQGQVWGYTAVLVEMKQRIRALGPLLFNVPLDRLEAINGASVSLRADALQLITSAERWSYSLIGSLRIGHASLDGPVVVRVRLQEDQGVIGLAVSAVGDISSLIRRTDGFEARTESQEVYLDLPDISAADSLIIQNESLDGASRVIVHSVDVLRPK